MVKKLGSLTLRSAFVALVAAGGINAACGKLVGIDDTEVGTAGAGMSSGGSSGKGGTGGASGKGSGGSAGKSSADGGTSTGGSSGQGGGADGGKGGAGGSGGAVTTGGSSGRGGKGGSAGASAGKGGGAGTGGDSGGSTAGGGEGGTPASGCTSGDTKCVSGVRQTCGSNGWEPDPCPLDNPTCEAGACIVRGPTMVKIPALSPYYIDSTEVTVAQYNAFLDAKGNDTSGQPSVCSWNLTYQPSSLPGKDDWPVSYVDWCDANAYCKWADKHLCAGIGGDTMNKDELFDETISQWFLACGGGGFHPNNDPMCNEQFGGDPTPVGSLPGCEGYVTGLFDMEGNVAEWVDVCDASTGADDICYPLGGSVDDSKSYCDELYDVFSRNESNYDVGFRCCSG